MTKAAPRAANDNDPPVDEDDIAVFDSGRLSTRLLERRKDLEWSPPRATAKSRGKVIFTIADGPSVEHRIRAQSAWISSSRHSGQAANDNVDWPLAKLLRAEGNDYLLRLAERYRDMWNAANMPCELVGRDLADNIYLMADIREDESTGTRKNKGVKKVKGKKARLDVPPRQALRTRSEQPKGRSAAVPKKWQGDWPLLHHIDCRRDLSAAQSALGPLREAFEAAVVGGETLEAIGRDHGVGNKAGAKGAGRALVYTGLQCLDEFWRKPANRAA